MGLPEGWLLQRRGQRGRNGPRRVVNGAGGMMLLGPGRIKAKGEKQKVVGAIDATGHAEYNEDASFRFSVSPYLTSISASFTRLFQDVITIMVTLDIHLMSNVNYAR